MKNQKQSLLTLLLLALSCGLCTMQAQIQEMPEETEKQFEDRLQKIENFLKEADIAQSNGDVETFEATVEEAQILANPEEADIAPQPDEQTVAPEQIAAELKAEVAETKAELATEAAEDRNIAIIEDQELKDMQKQEVQEEVKATQPAQKEQIKTKWSEKMLTKRQDWTKKREERENKRKAKHMKKGKKVSHHGRKGKTHGTRTSKATGQETK